MFYDSTHFPEKYRGRYLIADWTNNCIFLYNPMWDSALQMPAETMRKVVDCGVVQGGDLGYKGLRSLVVSPDRHRGWAGRRDGRLGIGVRYRVRPG